METIDYLRALRRSAVLVVVCVVACVIGAAFAVERTTPRYTTSARLIVSGSSSVGAVDEISQRELAATRATAFSQIAATQPAVSDAVTGAGYAPGTALPAVTASATADEPFITVTVNSTDRVLAARVANAFVTTLPVSVKRLDQVPSATPITLSVLSAAGVPGSPTSPNRKQDLGLGAVLGLLLGVAVALLREVSDRTLRDSDAAGAALGVTILGVIPYESPKEQLIASTKPRGIRTEAYRQVRTALIAADQLEGAPPLRKIIITSATAGEGKTSLVANLAKVYARAGHRVVVVDADLRRPKISGFYDLAPTAPGLADVLGGSVSLEDVTVLQDEGRLGILPAGPIPSNPSEALASMSMDTVLAQLSDRWDIILIDTPPVLPVADALILAPKVDGVVLVARLGETTVDKLRRARTAVEKVNGTLVGIVPNGARADDDSAYRYVYGKRNRNDAAYIDVVPTDAKPVPTTGVPIASAPIGIAPGVKGHGGRRRAPAAGAPASRPAPVAAPVAAAPPTRPAPVAAPVAAAPAPTRPAPVAAPVAAAAPASRPPAGHGSVAQLRAAAVAAAAAVPPPSRPAPHADAEITGPLPVYAAPGGLDAPVAQPPAPGGDVLPGAHRRDGDTGRSRFSPLR